MSTNDAVFQRRNKPIQDAIDAQNLKQALQLIEKRIKKGENSRFLQAWKANILFDHVDDAHRQRGIAETLELCKAEPPITDLDTLDILYETLRRMGGQQATINGLWERASKAKPRDLDLPMRWFGFSFEADDWKSAQKAAMTLQNNFPKNRKYHLWAIFLSYLVSVDEGSSEAERKLFGTLAYRMVSKAAESVPSDPKELLSAPRAIQTPEELLLLIKIFETQDCSSEVIKILDSENLGLDSRMVQNDWTFIQAKLRNLAKAQMWTESLSYAKGLLAISTDEEERKALQERDDWSVWGLITVATQSINTQETTSESLKFIDEFIQFGPKSRNAQLARLELLYYIHQCGNMTSHELSSNCQKFFDGNMNQLFCFGDLTRYLSILDKESQSKFVEYALSKVKDDGSATNDHTKGVSMINALKLEYCFLLSADESHASKDKVEDFVARCLQIYNSTARPEQGSKDEGSTIESQPSDDLCLLAAMSLMRFSGSWVSSNRGLEAAISSISVSGAGSSNLEEQVPDTTLIRAAAILERLVVDSPHNYYALLLLVRIYLRLGAGNLALKTFSKLSVKQLQYETVAHNLFTRLATIHPHSAPPFEGAELKDFNPQVAVVQALNFYKTADLTTVRTRSSGLEHGSYVNLEGTITLQKGLNQSICRRMYALDVKRMQRLVGGDPKSRYDDIARSASPLIDQRVYNAFMNCEAPGQPPFEHRVRVGPLPDNHWVDSARVTDQLFGVLKSLAAQKPLPADTWLPTVEELLGSDAGSSMTAAEIEGTRINLALLKVASYMSGSKSVTSEQVETCLAQVQEWLESVSKDLSMDSNKVSPIVTKRAIFLQSETPCAPSWKYFHYTFVVLESLKAISQVTSLALKKGGKAAKLPKERVERLLESARQVHESIRSNTRALKSHISESGVLGSLIDLVMMGPASNADGQQLQTELDKTVDSADVEVFCGDLMASWEEGLEGILNVAL